MSVLLSKSEWMRAHMPANRKRGNRKIFGRAVNDASYVVDPGKQTGVPPCPAYKCWMRMLIRCYSESFLCRNPTYVGVSVCDSWLLFSNFREWWVLHVVDDWELDKDLLHLGNTVYAPDNCVFVPKWLNRFLNDSAARRGEFPIGVYYHKRDRKFRAQLSLGEGPQITIGNFDTPDAAYGAWLSAKLNHALSKKTEMDAIDVRIFPNVMRRIETMK